MLNKFIRDNYGLNLSSKKKIVDGFSLYSNNAIAAPTILDKKKLTYFTAASGATQCYIGFDFGSNIRVELTDVRYNTRIDKNPYTYINTKL